jgi:hypothetical protein
MEGAGAISQYSSAAAGILKEMNGKNLRSVFYLFQAVRHIEITYLIY